MGAEVIQFPKKSNVKRIELRQDIDIQEIRKSAKKERNAKISRRMLAIAHLLEGGSLTEARKIACLSEMPMLRWTHRFNSEGIEGLRNRKLYGRPPKINSEVAEALKVKVLQGPDKSESLVRYRLVDLQRYLESTHNVYVKKSSLWNKLQEIRLTWKTPRQSHPKSDYAAQEAFKKTLVKA